MGMLDYSRFGPLGYQDQIQQANASLDQIMRHRAEMAQVDQQAKYHGADIALRTAQHKDQLAKDEATKKTQQLKDNLELQEKVNERLRAGDIEGARALVEARGGTYAPAQPSPPNETDAVSPEVASIMAPPHGPVDLGQPEQDSGPALPDVDAVAQKMSVPGLVEAMRARQAAGPADATRGYGKGSMMSPTDDPRAIDRNMPIIRGGNPDPRMDISRPPDVDPGMTAQPRRPMRFDLGTIDINADIPKGSVTRLDPSTQGAAEMAPAAKPEAQKFTYKTPDGRTISMDPEQVRTAGRQKAAQDFLATHMPEADALFQSAAGKPPEVAARIRAEATQQRADVRRIAAHIASGAVEPKNAASEAELAVRQRQGQSITEKDRYLEAGRNSRARMAADAARAGRAGDAGPGEPDTKRMTVYNSQLTEAKRNSLATKDLQQLRNVRQSLAETKDPNGPQMQIALDTIVKEAAGGRLSVQLEQNARNAMGGLTSAENFAYRQLHDGKNMPKYVNAYRKIIRDAQRELDSQLKSDAASFEHRVGAKSHWYKDPQMRPYVEDARRAYYEALGLGLPEQEQEGEPPVSNEEFINGH